MNLVELLSMKVDASKVKKVSMRCGGEYHSPCPLCGGEDRFAVFPEQEGGHLCQKHGLRGTWRCMRGCGQGGDMIAWFTEIEGLTFKAACAELNIENDEKYHRSAYRPLRTPHHTDGRLFEPHSYAPPDELWRTAATKLVFEAYHNIYEFPHIMSYLERRGLPQSAVDRYVLGYIEGEGNHPECIFRPRSAFGLPEKTGKDGKPLRAFRIPRGITIPALDENLRALRIRIRKRDIDRDKSNPKDPKYLLVPQPSPAYSAPLILWPKDVTPELAVWVIVESELDAMAVHHACQGLVGVISVLTAKGKPDAIAHEALRKCVRILVALDADETRPDGGNAGAEGWLWWQENYPQARLWPVPAGKDPGEAVSLGVDLKAWIEAGNPLRKPLAAGMNVKKPEPRTNSGNMGTPLKTVDETEKACVEAREIWPVANEVKCFSDLQLPERVYHQQLLSAMLNNPLDEEDALIPCPKTTPPFWWIYHRDCNRFKCKGHPQCILGVLKSEIFMEALNEQKNISR